MAIFMDRHDMKGSTAEDVPKATFCRGHGEIVLKGFEEPVRLHEVTWEQV